MQSIIDYFNKPLLKVSLIFGLITGLSAFIFFLTLYVVGIAPLSNVRVMDMGVFAILIAGACWYYRKKFRNGFLHLWEALTIGYVVLCIAAIINGWLIFLFVSYVDPGVFADYISSNLQLLTDGRKTQLNYLSDNEFLEIFKRTQNDKPSILIKDEISKKLLIGIIPILIISLIFRKQDYGIYQNKS
ncbi:DUF4199 domain-containing protein [Dyadobacter psychrotolerans]|uniref:DUF4199 domain-containing protein n=1 Tax=Dyadobacter psychrotolerans TaxID=2541721 RepID=A0A4V6PFP1_9BACT|nr:DUF4199 domain-containing protein [Dyadobacter psychrotolerans]TDE11108.1 DUF4199 domain-containing protein [Dyadobacter psychrotolerans]